MGTAVTGGVDDVVWGVSVVIGASVVVVVVVVGGSVGQGRSTHC